MNNQSQRTQPDAHQGKPPVIVHNDGPVFAKIWENTSEKGAVYYNVTVGKFYTDQRTGETRETNNLQKSDLPRMQYVTGKAYESISQLQQNVKQDETLETNEQTWLTAPEQSALQSNAGENGAAPRAEKLPVQSPEM